MLTPQQLDAAYVLPGGRAAVGLAAVITKPSSCAVLSVALPTTTW